MPFVDESEFDDTKEAKGSGQGRFLDDSDFADEAPPKDIKPLARQRLAALQGDAPPDASPFQQRALARRNWLTLRPGGGLQVDTGPTTDPAERKKRILAAPIPATEPPDTALYHPLRKADEFLADPMTGVKPSDMLTAVPDAVHALTGAMRDADNPYVAGLGETLQKPIPLRSLMDRAVLPGVSPEARTAMEIGAEAVEPMTSPESLALWGVPGTKLPHLGALPGVGTGAMLDMAGNLPGEAAELTGAAVAGNRQAVREQLPSTLTTAILTGMAGRADVPKILDAIRSGRKTIAPEAPESRGQVPKDVPPAPPQPVTPGPEGQAEQARGQAIAEATRGMSPPGLQVVTLPDGRPALTIAKPPDSSAAAQTSAASEAAPIPTPENGPVLQEPVSPAGGEDAAAPGRPEPVPVPPMPVTAAPPRQPEAPPAQPAQVPPPVAPEARAAAPAGNPAALKLQARIDALEAEIAGKKGAAQKYTEKVNRPNIVKLQRQLAELGQTPTQPAPVAQVVEPTTRNGEAPVQLRPGAPSLPAETPPAKGPLRVEPGRGLTVAPPTEVAQPRPPLTVENGKLAVPAYREPHGFPMGPQDVAHLPPEGPATLDPDVARRTADRLRATHPEVAERILSGKATFDEIRDAMVASPPPDTEPRVQRIDQLLAKADKLPAGKARERLEDQAEELQGQLSDEDAALTPQPRWMRVGLDQWKASPGGRDAMKAVEKVAVGMGIDTVNLTDQQIKDAVLAGLRGEEKPTPPPKVLPFNQPKEVPNATNQEPVQGGAQPEREAGDRGGPQPEAGGGDRVQRPAEGAGEGPGQAPVAGTGRGGPTEGPLGNRGRASLAPNQPNQPVGYRWRLVEADAPLTSHSDAMEPDARFPQEEMQNRDRSREDSEVQALDVEQRADAERLTDSAIVQEGSPWVEPDGLVPVGNNRLVGLRRGYRKGTEASAAYRAYLRENADRWGFDPEEVDQMRAPVLVRERIATPDLTRGRFAILGNVSGLAERSDAELATADARRLTPRIMAMFNPGEGGNVAAESNSAFRDAFLGMLEPSERGKLKDARGGLSLIGLQRVKNAVLAKAYGDTRIVERAIEGAAGDPAAEFLARNIITGLYKAAPSMARLDSQVNEGTVRDFGIQSAVRDAIAKYGSLKLQGLPVADYFRQEDMFSEPMSFEARQVLAAFEGGKTAAGRIASYLDELATAVEAAGPMEGPHAPTPEQVFDAARRELEAKNPAAIKQGSLFEAAAGGGPSGRGTAREDAGNQGGEGDLFGEPGPAAGRPRPRELTPAAIRGEPERGPGTAGGPGEDRPGEDRAGAGAGRLNPELEALVQSVELNRILDKEGEPHVSPKETLAAARKFAENPVSEAPGVGHGGEEAAGGEAGRGGPAGEDDAGGTTAGAGPGAAAGDQGAAAAGRAPEVGQTFAYRAGSGDVGRNPYNEATTGKGVPREPRHERIPRTAAPPPPTNVLQSFKQEDIDPVYRGVKDATKQLAKDVHITMSASTISNESKLTADQIRRGESERDFRMARITSAVKGMKRFFDQRKPADRMQDAVDFIGQVERGEKPTDPKLQQYAALTRTILDSLGNEVRQWNPDALQEWINGYFPHLWAKPEAAAEFAHEWLKQRSAEGPKTFLKHRFYELLQDGIDAGLRMKTDNPADILVEHAGQVQKYLTWRKIRSRGIESNWRVWSTDQGNVPAGWDIVHHSLGDIYGDPRVLVGEAVTERFKKLEDLSRDLGIEPERLPGYGPELGQTQIRGKGPDAEARVLTRFGTPESVLAHELGHVLDKKFGMGEGIFRSDDARPQVQRELNELAALRYRSREGEISQAERAYVHSGDEKVANFLDAFVTAPEVLRNVAPTALGEFRSWLKTQPQLDALWDMAPGLELEERVTAIPIKGKVIVAHWIAPRESVKLIDRYLSPGIQNKALYKTFRGTSNVLNSVQLGVSGFHGVFTALDTVPSTLGLALQHGVEAGRRAVAGEEGAGEMAAGALRTAGKGLVAPAALWHEGYQLEQAAKAVPIDADLSTLPAPVQRVIRAGGGFGQDAQYGIGAVDSMIRAWDRGNVLGAGARAAPAMIEALAKPIMEWWVPRLKLGVFAQEARFEMERLGPDATAQEVDHALGRVWDSVDNRLGQLRYQNLLWNRTFKDLGQVALRSLGWNLGSLREVGGGVFDVATAGKRARRIAAIGEARAGLKDAKAALDRLKAEGGSPEELAAARAAVKAGEAPNLEDPVFTRRMAYSMALPVVVGLLGAVYKTMKTGKPPDNLKDAYAIPTGGRNPDGSEERVFLPSYVRDFYAYGHAPLTTILHKISPGLGTLRDLAKNEDYFGTEIRDTNAPALEQAKDVADHIGKQFVPISIQQAMKSQFPGSNIRTAESMLGVAKAPADLSRSPAEQAIIDEIRKGGHGARSQEAAGKSRAKGEIKAYIRGGFDEQAAAKIEALKDAGELSEAGRKKLYRDASTSTLEAEIRRMPIKDALRVYRLASPQERAKWADAMRARVYGPQGKPGHKQRLPAWQQDLMNGGPEAQDKRDSYLAEAERLLDSVQ